jgi:hypothetical protein
MAVRARGSTGCTTSSSSSTLLEVRFEFDRSRLAVLSVRVRCIFRFDEVTLFRCRTEACNIELISPIIRFKSKDTHCAWSM